MRARWWFVAAAVVLWAGGTAVAGPLSPAGDSAVFSLGDLSVLAASANGDVTGGGNVTLNSFSSGNVYAGGNVSLEAGAVTGNVYAVGTVTQLADSVSGTVTQNGSPLFNFAALGQQLRNASANAAAQPASGAVSGASPGVLTLTGTDPSLNVFDLATLAPGTNVSIVAPAGSTVLVNVAGSSLDLTGDLLNSASPYDPTHVLFNFPDATSVSGIGSIHIDGTLLAPLADISLGGLQGDGSIIGNTVSVEAGFVISAPFAGEIPAAPAPPPPVPEPSTLALLALGGLGLALRRWQKRRV